MFTHRLLRYYNMQNQFTSFIADIYRLLVKYGLRYILDNYIEAGAFPPKCYWKRLLTDKVVTRNKQDTLYRLNTSVGDLSTWLRLGYPCLLWLVSKKRQELAPLCTKAVRILSKLVSRTYVNTCEKCLLTTNIVVHKLCFCSSTTDERSNVWNLYQQYFGFKALRELLGLTPSAQSKQIVKYGP